VLDTDGRFSHRFDAPGVYSYYCSLHPKMTGRVTVS
jgi:plastocyanin